MTIDVLHGDSREVIPLLGENVFDSCVCDPPYALQSISKRFANSPRNEKSKGQHAFGRHAAGFMGKKWDTGETAFDPAFWRLVWVALKPGAYLIAFGGSRTYHRLACAIEDAGFIIHPLNGWIFGSGFPKATDLSKQLDKANSITRDKIRIPAAQVRNRKATGAGRDGMDGATRPWIEQALENGYHEAVSDEAVSDEAVSWRGWRYGTQSQKPALEPICFAQKPIDGKRMIDNIRKWGVGAVNVDACRVEGVFKSGWSESGSPTSPNLAMSGRNYERDPKPDNENGRWPANICHDGSDEVLASFPDSDGQQRAVGPANGAKDSVNTFGGYGPRAQTEPRGDSDSAARYFYSAKADQHDRWGSKHPTVKPIDLIRHYVRFITPPGGLCLDPFAGSGTTGVACLAERMRCVMIEREAEYVADIEARLTFYRGDGAHSLASKGRKIESSKASGADAPLFAHQIATGAEEYEEALQQKRAELERT